MKMVKSKFSKVKAAIVSGILAVTSVAASIPAAMPSITADAANDNYAKLLQYSLYFYDANMCGKDVESKSLMTWRGNCHTSDEVPGGFHDAGDHAMFGLPQGFTASVLGESYYEFSDSFDSLGQTEHFKTIMTHFCDFFKASTKLSGGNVSNFLYQKGDGNEDHGYWGAPELQSGSRKMFWTSNSASDIAADYAAALAINYLNFGNKEDLTYAEALYKFSTQNNRIESNGPDGFYLAKGASCIDEQANAAGWLYLATKNESYKSDCASKQTQYLGWIDGWDNRGLGAATVYAKITGDWSKVNSYIGSNTGSSNYLCLDDWGSARLNCAMQLSALIATKESSADYSNWCKGQMDYLLGNNPFNTCMVTGFASNSCKNVHHRAASGWQGYDGADGFHEGVKTYNQGKCHTLIGALTGGPNKAGQYSDVIDDYMCNEVAIDYNAGLVGAAAGLYHVYKSGSVDKSIEGTKSAGTDPVTPTTTTPKTTTAYNPGQQTTEPKTTTAPSNPTASSDHELKLNQKVVYSNLPKDDKMIGWDWADFGVTNNDKITKVEVNISANGNIGKWQGAFGTSTTVKPEYWAQTDDMSQTISSNSGTITWKIDSDISSVIQTQYEGQLKFGIWWIDCDTFTIDSIKVYTEGGSSTTTAPKTTTTKKTTTTTTKTNPTASSDHELKLNQKVVYSDLPKDDKMIGWDWADFGVTNNDKITKVEVNISANGNIGKWQGAFGTSTTVKPEYWAQTDDMSQTISSNSGTITWKIDSDISSVIQTQYEGQLKFGIWWIDCDTFTIDSIKVYTEGGSSTTTTKKVTTTTTTTKKTTTTTTTKKVTTTTTTTAKPTTTTAKQPLKVNLAGDANCDNKVNIADAVLVKCYLLNVSKFGISEQGAINADVEGNNNGLNANDAIAIQKIILGL